MTDGHVERDWFSKPGDSLRALMQRRSIPAAQLAERLPGGMDAVRGMLEGSLAIDERMASVLSDHVGGSTSFWLKRQATYDADLERAVDAAAKSELDEWLAQVPAPTARSLGTRTDLKAREELRRRLIFFNVPTMRSWETRYGQLRAQTRFRTSQAFSSKDSAVIWWLRQGEIESDLIGTRAWNPDNLRDRLEAIRRLSRVSRPERFLPKLRNLCAEAGVALVVVKAPKGCHASGASRLVTSDRAMILLSFRHRADDHFWFTVFHEIGHLLLHGAQTFVDEEGTPEDDAEREANAFASSCIIPDSREDEFSHLRPDRDAVIRYSVSIGVSPGMTVGQMQHRKMITHNRLNALKRFWKWNEIEAALD